MCLVLPTPPIMWGGFCPFLSLLTFTFSQNHLPATCNCHRPRTCLGFLPLPSPPCYTSPFGWQMSLRGFWTQHPVPGGCWLLSESVPSPPEETTQPAVGETPQPTLCPGVGPEVVLLSLTGVVRLHLPCLTPLWGQCDVVLGTACHHPGAECHHLRYRLALPWGRQDHTPGMA